MAWRVYIPTDGRRDGLFSVQIFGDQILVQNRSGTISAIDPRDGIIQWRRVPTNPYRVTQALGSNRTTIFLVQGINLFALDRKTGKTKWEIPLPEGPSSAPAADDEQVYICAGLGQLYAFTLPEAVPVPPGAVQSA